MMIPATTAFESWIAAFLTWFEANQELAALLVFLFGFAESIVLLAVLVPSSVLFAGVGATYAASGGSLELLWLAGSVGAVLGDTASFALGHFLRDDAATVWPLRRYPRLLEKGRAVFRRWGWFALILSKFTFGLRPFVPIAAGVLSMRYWHFLAASAASSLLWAGVSLGFGYAAAKLVISHIG